MTSVYEARHLVRVSFSGDMHLGLPALLSTSCPLPCPPRSPHQWEWQHVLVRSTHSSQPWLFKETSPLGLGGAVTCGFAPGPSLCIYREHAFCFSWLAWGWGQGKGEDEGLDHGMRSKARAHGAWSTMTHLSAESI